MTSKVKCRQRIHLIAALQLLHAERAAAASEPSRKLPRRAEGSRRQLAVSDTSFRRRFL